MARLGVWYVILRVELPRLVYCAISGLGQEGPLSKMPAYDQVTQRRATSCLSPLITILPRALTDTVWRYDGGLRRCGGGGQIGAGPGRAPTANDIFTASPTGTFKTADDPINIAADKQEQFDALCRVPCALCHVIGQPDLAPDPRFSNRMVHLAHRADLTDVLEAAFVTAPSGDWVIWLTQRGIPAALVWTVPQALSHPYLADRGLLQTHAAAGEYVQLVGVGVKLDGDGPKVDGPS